MEPPQLRNGDATYYIFLWLILVSKTKLSSSAIEILLLIVKGILSLCSCQADNEMGDIFYDVLSLASFCVIEMLLGDWRLRHPALTLGLQASSQDLELTHGFLTFAPGSWTEPGGVLWI